MTGGVGVCVSAIGGGVLVTTSRDGGTAAFIFHSLSNKAMFIKHRSGKVTTMTT